MNLNVSTLLGKTLTSITNTGEEVVFRTTEGETYKLYHSQDCCESVSVEDVVGNLDDLIGAPLLLAEESTSHENPPASDYTPESFTWTFYRFGTVKGYVTIRFYGTSNGYYSEGVDFAKIDA